MGKRGLGRGLAALLPGADGESESSLLEVPLTQISASPYQPRQVFNDEAIDELSQSIREHGVLQPVILKRVAPDAYELVAGERRFRAAKQAGLTSIPALVRDYQPPQMLEVALIENLQREDINAVDAAQAYQRLRSEFGLTQEEIARRVGKAQSTIANTLRLLALPDSVLESVQKGEISEGHARAILQARPEAQHQVWENARKLGLSVRETERMAREVGQAHGPSTRGRRPHAVERTEPDPHMLAAEEALQVALGTKVRIRSSGDVGQIIIDFYSEAELDGIIERVIGV
jgi:ParB family chromosome partitioning protein